MTDVTLPQPNASTARAYTRSMTEPRSMDDERWEPGMPVLDRQVVPGATPAPAGRSGARPVPGPLPPSLAGLPPRSVPETKPTRLQQQYVLMSVPGLIAGFIAITALELGMPLSSPLIKLCVLIGAPLLVVANADAIVRIWRAAWAWMPVDRTKGLFRLAWVAVACVSWLLLIALALLVLFA
jgi:hypothetical protein